MLDFFVCSCNWKSFYTEMHGVFWSGLCWIEQHRGVSLFRDWEMLRRGDWETDSLMWNTVKDGFLPQRHEDGTKCTKFFGTPIVEIGVILKICFTWLSPWAELKADGNSFYTEIHRGFLALDCVERDAQSPKLRTFHLFWFQVSSLRFFGRQTGKTGIFVMLSRHFGIISASLFYELFTTI